MTNPSEPRDRNRVQSVGRAMHVLNVLAEDHRGLGVVQLSERVGLPISSVHRLLATLVDYGFVAQFAATGRYHIGVQAFEVGNAFLRQVRLREIARPYIYELVALTQETANLALCDGDSAIYVDQVQSTRTLQVIPRPGARVPLHCSAVGKVFLAGMTDQMLEHTLEELNLPSWTNHTIIDTKALRAAILQVRSDGFAIDDQEMQLGVRCIASPIYDHARETAAALSLTGPSEELQEQRLQTLSTQLCRIASVISEQLEFQRGHTRTNL